MDLDAVKTNLIFSGEDIRVLYSEVNSVHETLIVTFTPLVHKDFDPPLGFGQLFFTKRGYSTLCFISARPHWWQVTDIFDALTEAVKVTGRFKKIVCYGSSMGAYGALMFSGRLEATHVIAAAPQFSIDVTKAPFEHRWPHHAKNIDFFYDDMNENIASSAEKYIIYDYMTIDKKHVDMIKSENIIRIGLPLIGHAPLASLSHLDLLKDSILDIINERFVASQLVSAVKRRRLDNPDYWTEAAALLYHRGKFKGSIAASERAILLAPKPVKPRMRLAQARMRAGDVEGGLTEIEAAVALSPRHMGVRKMHLIILAKVIRSVGKKPDEYWGLHQRYAKTIENDAEIERLFYKKIQYK